MEIREIERGPRPAVAEAARGGTWTVSRGGPESGGPRATCRVWDYQQQQQRRRVSSREQAVACA